MSDNDLYSDVYDDEPEQAPQQTGPKALREYADAQRARADELEKRLAKIEADNKRQTLATALKGTGVNPDALGDYLNDLDPEKATDQVAAWRKAFGITDAGEPAGLSDEETKALASVSGDPGGSAPATPTDDVAAMKGLQTEDEFWAFIESKK